MFKRPVQRYGVTPEPVTPYQKAAQVWDNRIGSAVAQAANWRHLALGALSLSFGLGGGLIWSTTQSRVVPYVVEVDGLGAVRAVGPVTTAYNPTDAQLAWHLGRFITLVRSLPTDPVLVRSQWLDAYDMASGEAATFLSEHARLNDPFANVGRQSITVAITNVVRASKSSFQVKWTEQVFENGQLVRSSRWTAIVGIKVQTPTREETLRKNPLGLYVTDLAWSSDYAPELSKSNP
ncbi:conjugal transfer protein TrbF [Asticcacaulis machinosus]|uniref:Conjugal transfer protein TrbF n=1 Tax=Asticcacaulis machinosus TaxID=2984211 RepID=A0ABT5HFW7_9CAUL|nr:conjugal transfer protein TrbF [Asticcacaulis machinosus]MDC7675150.1 conjugal transfer protein TrbF [Asticcacaulis machinosus]